MTLDKFQLATRNDATARYGASATVMVGAVHRALWTIGDAREVASELISETSEVVAWVSDPSTLDLEPREQLVVLGPNGHTVLANGKRPRGALSGVDRGVVERFTAGLRRVTERHPEPPRAHVPRAWSSLVVEAAASWVLFRGAQARRADLILGLPLAAGKTPSEHATVVRTPGGKLVAGARIASVDETPWKTFAFSPRALAALDTQARDALGPLAKNKTLTLHLVVDGEVVAVGDAAAPPEPAPPVSPEREARALSVLVSEMNDLAPDVFDRPIRFASVARDGERLVVELKHGAEPLQLVMRWTAPIAGDRDEPSSALIGELTREVNDLFADE